MLNTTRNTKTEGRSGAGLEAGLNVKTHIKPYTHTRAHTQRVMVGDLPPRDGGPGRRESTLCAVTNSVSETTRNGRGC